MHRPPPPLSPSSMSFVKQFSLLFTSVSPSTCFEMLKSDQKKMHRLLMSSSCSCCFYTLSFYVCRRFFLRFLFLSKAFAYLSVCQLIRWHFFFRLFLIRFISLFHSFSKRASAFNFDFYQARQSTLEFQAFCCYRWPNYLHLMR